LVPLHCPLWILGVIAKLRKANISFVMSVRPSVLPPFRIEQLGSHQTDLNEIWHLSTFLNCVEKIQVPLRSDKNEGYFT
jgi:hypothetical protein